VTVKHLSNAKSLSTKLRDALVEWENRLVPPPAEPTNAAAAAVRSDVRRKIDAMKAPDREVYLAQTDLPRDVFAAVLEGPAFLSGVSDVQRAKVLQSYRATHHASDVAQIAQAREAIDLLDAVSSTVTNEASRIGGFAPHEFAKFADVAA
jgi:hypothetical protein